MRVRLRDAQAVLVDTIETRLNRFAFRTIRHQGVLYERIADGADGVPEYRAPDVVLPTPRLITFIDSAGNDCGTTMVPAGDLPATVTHANLTCTLWTVKDQAGRSLYMVPDGV